MAEARVWVLDRDPQEEGFYIASKIGNPEEIRHFNGRGWSLEGVHVATFNADDARLLIGSGHSGRNNFLPPLAWVRSVPITLDKPRPVRVESKVTDGWIDWSGGACPVPDGTLVEIRRRDGGCLKRSAGSLRWNFYPLDTAGDIVGYRVVGERRTEARHSHYFKSVKGLDQIDVYRVLQLFEVTDPCLQHAIKKLLVPGKRGAGKDIERDVREAIDTLKRWQEMQQENSHV